MIIGIGIDLISNDRIKKILKKFDKNFKEKIFSKNELIDFDNRYKDQEKLTQNAINFFAKRFASKEAFSKALGIGIGRGIDFNDIEILTDETVILTLNDSDNGFSLQLCTAFGSFNEKYIYKSLFVNNTLNKVKISFF